MNTHLDPEQLSCFIDNELPEAEQRATQEHLDLCAQCARLHGSLLDVTNQLFSLEPPELSIGERRKLNSALFGSSAPSPARRSRRLGAAGRTSWRSPRRLLAGGMTAVIVGAVGFFLARSPGDPAPSYQEAVQASPAVNLESDGQIRDVVIGQSRVAAGLDKYTVTSGAQGDEGANRSQDQAPAPAPGRDSSAPDSPEAASGAQDLATPEAPANYSHSAGEDCLRKIRATQPYSMAPLLARPAIYKGTEAWLLVFAWTPMTDANAPLDRVQVWVVRPQDCAALQGESLIEKVLHYSFFKPS